MYKPRARPAANGALPPMKKIFATSSFTCACGRHVPPGKAVYVDGLNYRQICLSCGTLPSASNVIPVTNPDDWQKRYDRMRALENLPGPLKQSLQNELDSLRRSCLQKSRRDTGRSPERDDWLFGIYIKYAESCARCDVRQEVGTYVVWHRARKFVICPACLKTV